jgi:hypothetical protein
MWNAAYYVEGVALDCEDLSLALAWAPVVASLAGDATIHALRASDHDYFMARIEYMQGDFRRARFYLDRSRKIQDSLPRERGELSVLALDVLLRVRNQDGAIPTRLLSRLHRLHLRTRDSGVQDFEAAAIVAGHLHSGNRIEAEALYDYYARVRRSRIDRHSTLQQVAKDLAR